MKYYAHCETAGHTFCEEINFADEFAIYDLIANKFDDDVHNAIDSYIPDPCGFFTELTSLYKKMYSAAGDYLDSVAEKFPVYIRTVDNSGNMTSEEKVDVSEIFDKILENRSMCECSDVDLGPHIITALEKFLEQGIWQYGLQSETGSINSIPSTWSEPVLSENNVMWGNKTSKLKPIIWFGLNNKQPIECWTISKDEKMFELVYGTESYNPIICRVVERWKPMWFNHLRAFDWDTLLGNESDILIFWMFAECDLSEPELGNTIITCPINLDENDTCENLKGKIDNFFLKQYNTAHQRTV